MFSATDISSFLACPHTATLKKAELEGEVEKPFRRAPALELLRKLGQEHEQEHLHKLEGDGLQVAKIDAEVRWAEGMAETSRTMKRGVDVIYQGVLLDGNWGGRPDFLVKITAPSKFGDWSYEETDWNT